MALGKCSKCGDDSIVNHERHGLLCEDCSQELVFGVIPSMSKITSGKTGHVPLGMSIRRVNDVPGTGDGNDYFGNHT